MVKIFILASLKQANDCISLASAIHNKNGCQAIILVPAIDYLNFPKSNINCEIVQINNLKEIEQNLLLNKFTCGILFSNVEDSDAFFILKVRSVKNGEYSFESKKGVTKCTVKNNSFVEDADKDIPLLSMIYKNSLMNYVFNIDNKYQFLLKGSSDQYERIPIYPYKIKDYNNTDGIVIKPLCNWESSMDMFNDFKRFTKDGNGRWNNLVLDPTATKPDYYLVLNSTQEAFDPSKTIWFCMEPKMETHPAWSQFCTYMNNYNPLYNGSHSLQMNNVEWHINKTYSELLSLNIEKKHDKVLSIVVSDRCVDEGHKLRLDLIKDLDERASSTSLFGLKSNNKLGFDVHIYGKCSSLKFKNYKGELPKASKENGIFPYKYHFNAENHSYDNYITEKFTDGIVGETVFFYWGCPNANKYYNENSFIRLSLKKEDREQDIKKIQDAILNDEWSKRISSIRKEKERLIKVYSMFPRIESIISLNNTTVLLEPMPSDEDMKVRCDYLLKQNFKDIQMVKVNKGMRVFLDVFNMCANSNKNIMLLFNTTNVIDVHHKLTVAFSEARMEKEMNPDLVMIDTESFLVTPDGAKRLLFEIQKMFQEGGGASFEQLLSKIFHKKL